LILDRILVLQLVHFFLDLPYSDMVDDIVYDFVFHIRAFINMLGCIWIYMCYPARCWQLKVFMKEISVFVGIYWPSSRIPYFRKRGMTINPSICLVLIFFFFYLLFAFFGLCLFVKWISTTIIFLMLIWIHISPWPQLTQITPSQLCITWTNRICWIRFIRLKYNPYLYSNNQKF